MGACSKTKDGRLSLVRIIAKVNCKVHSRKLYVACPVTNGIIVVMYVSITRQLVHLQNCFGVVSLWPAKGLRDVFSFQVSPRATKHCYAGNMLSACMDRVGQVWTVLRMKVKGRVSSVNKVDSVVAGQCLVWT